MSATIEAIKPTVSGGGDIIIPPVFTAERNGDGEGDGRFVAAGIMTAEAYANTGTIVEMDGGEPIGIDLAEVVYGAAHRSVLRNRARSFTGRMAVYESPLYLT